MGPPHSSQVPPLQQLCPTLGTQPDAAAQKPQQPAPQKPSLAAHPPTGAPLNLGGADRCVSDPLYKASKYLSRRQSTAHEPLYLSQPNQRTPLLCLWVSPSLPGPLTFLGRAPPNQAPAPSWGDTQPLAQHSRHHGDVAEAERAGGQGTPPCTPSQAPGETR